MEQSTEIKELLAALCNVQGEMPTMPKDKQGYSYRYTDFDTIVTTIKPLLKKNNIGFMQSLTMVGESPAITTRMFSQSGQYIQDTVTLPKVEMKGTTAAQNMGASITYMKRYALCAMFGITADEDVDGVTQATQVAQSKQTGSTTSLEKKRIELESLITSYDVELHGNPYALAKQTLDKGSEADVTAMITRTKKYLNAKGIRI